MTVDENMEYTLPTRFELRLPKAIDDALEKAFNAYRKQLLVPPKMLEGKIVVEQTSLPVAGATHIVRKLVTADYGKADYGRASGPSPSFGAKEPGYWESWMGVLTGAENNAKDCGFRVQQVQVFVHRDGGWMLVHNAFGKTDAPLHEEGDPWPEPNGEPPANKGIINTTAAFALKDQPGFEQLAKMVQEMIVAGGMVAGDELVIDFRNEEQRRRFWAYNAEVKKLWPGI